MTTWREYVQNGKWSSGAVIAWQIAASEAKKQGYPVVKPLHLLIGLCSIQKAFSGDSDSLGVSKEAKEDLLSEYGAFSRILAIAGVNEALVRRVARSSSAGAKRERDIHNESSLAREIGKIITVATQLAPKEEGGVIGLPQLLGAVLQCADQAIAELLQDCRIDMQGLTAGLANASSAGPFARAYVADISTMDVLQSGGPTGSAVDAQEEFTQTIGADLGTSWSKLAFAEGVKDRLDLLCELPLKFGEQTCLESLLQIIVERVTSVIPGALRGALLLVEEGTGNLLLKAHLPPGRPAVSLKLAQRAIQQREAFILSEDQDINTSLQELSSMSSMYAPLLWRDEVLGVVCVDNPKRGQPFADGDLRLLLAVAQYAALAVANLRLQSESEQSALLLGRVLTSFSPKVRERLLLKARQGKMRLGGDRSEVTILCADIRGFTRLSASMDAQEVMDLLNHYFPTLVEAVFRFNGTVDKYIGDAILAVFGSPDPDSAQYENAVRAAAHMQSAMQETNTEREKQGLTTCNIGIGIHCGEVLHGFIGSPDRMEFTVIGDVVNKATRYCDGAKSGETLISPKVYEYTWRMIQAEHCNISTKHQELLPAYRLMGVRRPV